MKNLLFYIFLLFLSSTLFFSCKKDLNVSPQNIIQDGTVFSNESAINAYFASLYSDLPIEEFMFSVGGGFNGNASPSIAIITDEATTCPNDDGVGIGGGISLGWWGYGSVRNVNEFIAKISTANFPVAKINEWLGEAKFIRAYYYFGMVKRYGGVPLVTDVQEFTGSNLDQLKVPRNTEQEIYDFIAKELDAAALLLNETSDVGRANKYAAYALKSRAMIYAASEAEYGNMQLNGLTGIPAFNAVGYWKAAHDAANLIIASGKYSLYNKSAD